MYPDREMLRRWSFCHRQPSCWSRMLEPIVNVLTTEFALTSQTLEVLSPEAESKWVLSGLQLICSDETRVARQTVSVGRGLRKQLCPAPTSERGEAGRQWARMRRASRPRHLFYVTLKLCPTTPTLKLLTVKAVQMTANTHRTQPQPPGSPKPHSRRKRLRREPCLLPGRTPSRPSFRHRRISLKKQRRAWVICV